MRVVSGCSFKCSVTEWIQKFYKCANAIFRIEGRSDDLTMLRLVESHCVPIAILTYGIEIVQFADSKERGKIRAAYNSLYRKIFGYRLFESVTQLQLNLARPTWEMLIDTLKAGFLSTSWILPSGFASSYFLCIKLNPPIYFNTVWLLFIFLHDFNIVWINIEKRPSQ